MENPQVSVLSTIHDPYLNELAAWREVEEQLFKNTLAKKDDLESKGSGSLLNDALFGKFQGLCERFGVTPQAQVLAGLLPSVRSTLGNSCERLLATYAAAAVRAPAVCPRRGPLVAYLTGFEFEHRIKKLRAARTKLDTIDGAHDKPGSLAKAREKLATAPQNTDREREARERRVEAVTELETQRSQLVKTLESVSEFANEFYVQEAHVQQLTASTERISYPDSVSVFERAVVIAQHELSGETDINNTDADARSLADQVLLFEHLVGPVEAIVVLPCAKSDSIKTRWTKALSAAAGPWERHDVYHNEHIWTGLFGTGPATDREYDRFLDRLAGLGADRLFHCFAPPGVELQNGRWGDFRAVEQDRPSPPTGTWLVEIPPTAPPEGVLALLELLDSMNVSVTFD